MIDLMDKFSNKFYFDRNTKKKYMTFYKLVVSEVSKENLSYYLVKAEYNIGEMVCDFLNTDFDEVESIKLLLSKYGLPLFANLTDLKIPKESFTIKEFDKIFDKFVKEYTYAMKEYQELLKNDLEYTYNMNQLEELSDLTPKQRFFVISNGDRSKSILSNFDDSKVNINFSAFQWINDIPFATREDVTQKIAPEKNITSPYFIKTTDILQNLIIELAEMTAIDGLEVKKCKNCNKFFVPENRSDELYCSNIYENGKTCKEVGHFRVGQRLMKENDDLRIYRNVYQKLLLRTRRNPNNVDYARDFEFFKDDNNKWKENISNGKATQEEYMKWLNKQ